MDNSSPAGWQWYTVQDLAANEPNAFIGNTFGSMLKASEYQTSGIPVLRGENLAGPGRFNPVASVFVTSEKAEELTKQTALPEDVVFTQQGTNRDVGIIPKGCLFQRWVVSQSQMRLRVDRRKVDPLYVYYYFSQNHIKDKLQSLAIVTGVPHINLGILRRFPFLLPPLEEQLSILGILGPIDDKIVLVRRTNETLESIVRALFRWV